MYAQLPSLLVQGKDLLSVGHILVLMSCYPSPLNCSKRLLNTYAETPWNCWDNINGAQYNHKTEVEEIMQSTWESEQREYWRKSLFELVLDGFNIISPDWKGMGLGIGRIPHKAAGFCRETGKKVQSFLHLYGELVQSPSSRYQVLYIKWHTVLHATYIHLS